MDSFERFRACMAHEQPDRVPVDIGATSLTGMRPACQESLKQLLGFSGEHKLSNNRIDERILEWAGTDFRSVGALVSPPSIYNKKISDTCYIDSWNIERELIDGQWQISRHPLHGVSIEDLHSFKWPEPCIDEALLEKWEQDAKELKGEDTYVIIAEHPVFGILELACWVCGYDDLMLKLALEPDFIKTLFDKLLDYQLKISKQYYSVLGPYIKLTTSGDDFGTQTGPFISPEMFENLIAPPFSERIKCVKDTADCYFWHHTCGSVFDLLDLLIGCGVDLLDPVQTSACKMDPAELKNTFGNKIVFWGGVDVQQFLPHAKPEDIPEKIDYLINTLGKDGGYVMAPAHEMQDDIPAENIAAWVEAIKIL